MCVSVGSIFHRNFDVVQVYPLEYFRVYVPGLYFGLD